MIGILMLLVSLITKGQIGTGDGIIFCITGLGLGFWNNLWLLMLSLFMAGIFSGILWMLKRVGRKSEIPFVPFILISYLGVLCLC